jgi:hypothetical protein
VSVQFVNEIDIERPMEEVFSYLADFENTPALNYAIVETFKTSAGPVGVATTYWRRMHSGAIPHHDRCGQDRVHRVQ